MILFGSNWPLVDRQLIAGVSENGSWLRKNINQSNVYVTSVCERQAYFRLFEKNIEPSYFIDSLISRIFPDRSRIKRTWKWRSVWPVCFGQKTFVLYQARKNTNSRLFSYLNNILDSLLTDSIKICLTMDTSNLIT